MSFEWSSWTLDTDIISELWKAAPDPNVLAWVGQLTTADKTSTIGSLKSNNLPSLKE
jgi:predicted nucleic acid-binding protein